MTSKDENSLQMIATQSPWRILFNTIFLGIFCSFFAAIFFMAAIYVTPPPVGDNVYAIPFVLILVTVVLAILRNKILQFIFKKMSHSEFLKLVHFGRTIHYILIISGSFFLIIGFLIVNARLISLSFGLLLIWAIMFSTFDEPLTYTGETRLLFELLRANLRNFGNRQPYLRRISRTVEKRLRMGNIKVPYNEFVYYFNIELFKGTLDIQNDLKNIEAWLVDNETPCFESLKKIYPENKFEPFKRHSLFIQLIKSPTIKGILYVIALIALALSPMLQSEVLKLISRLLGIGI